MRLSRRPSLQGSGSRAGPRRSTWSGWGPRLPSSRSCLMMKWLKMEPRCEVKQLAGRWIMLELAWVQPMSITMLDKTKPMVKCQLTTASTENLLLIIGKWCKTNSKVKTHAISLPMVCLQECPEVRVAQVLSCLDQATYSMAPIADYGNSMSQAS